MDEKRRKSGVRRHERPCRNKMPIAGLWLDYHGTVVVRKHGAVKAVAEKVLKTTIAESAETIDRTIEEVRLILEEQNTRVNDGIENWVLTNYVAFSTYGCTIEQARRMSEHMRGDENYFFPVERQKFIKWLVTRFPPKSTNGRYVLMASNAKFQTIANFVSSRKFPMVVPVSADLLGLYKPNLAFFERLIRVTGVPPERTLFVANSYLNDPQAAVLGVNVVIILPPSVPIPECQVANMISPAKGKVFVVRSVSEAKEVIERNFRRIR